MPLIASFFSYKGGAGRTTSTLNTTYYLVTEVLRPTAAHPLIIIDADTESAGISYLLTEKIRYRPSQLESLQSLCYDAQKNAATFFNNNGSNMSEFFPEYAGVYEKFIKVGDQFGMPRDAVLLLRSNERSFDMIPDQFVPFIEELVKLLRNTCKCSIIFDTPSGTQALTRCALRWSNTIVCHMRPTKQFHTGTKEYLEEYFGSVASNKKKVVLCPSVVPLPRYPVCIDGYNYPETYLQEFGVFADEMKKTAENSLEVEVVDLMAKATPERFYIEEFKGDLRDWHRKPVVGIPEIDRFKWREGLLPPVQEKSPEEKLACERYRYLANIVAGNV